ncbi:hypothetical protein [Granulicella tundricola]|uniref:Uncharacterized protein n=1 Tax=Granulicella tundricola (strain ATCC BAA-1859 / DSM 23138 / MP5ACTX9) TaxID=1198114 RepID=E8WZG6_GRATM|nr:hypothetical protein [Granulicella tundricola]ADW68854.1 hypothetical protein AciX9_1806 [Granulicella tundricola MP5ACTX9]
MPAHTDRPRFDQSQFADLRFRQDRRRAPRPIGVTLIATFQILKGTVLLLTAIMLRWYPGDVLGPQSIFYPVLYVATRGNTVVLQAASQGSNILPGFFFLLGSYITATGFGLLQLQKWARRTVMFNSSMTLLLWAKATLLNSSPSFGTSGLGGTSSDLTNFYILLFFDVLVFAYLIRSNAADVFEIRSRA